MNADKYPSWFMMNIDILCIYMSIEWASIQRIGAVDFMAHFSHELIIGKTSGKTICYVILLDIFWIIKTFYSFWIYGSVLSVTTLNTLNTIQFIRYTEIHSRNCSSFYLLLLCLGAKLLHLFYGIFAKLCFIMNLQLIWFCLTFWVKITIVKNNYYRYSRWCVLCEHLSSFYLLLFINFKRMNE